MGIPYAAFVDLRTMMGSIGPPVAGAIAGGLITGLLVQRHWAKRSSESLLIDTLVKDLDALVEKTLEYWSLDYHSDTKKDKETSEKARGLAAKIKAGLKKLRLAVGEYCERYCKKKKDGFIALVGELHDACTNGAFDAAKRGPDHDRYLTVVNAANRLRSALFERRV